MYGGDLLLAEGDDGEVEFVSEGSRDGWRRGRNGRCVVVPQLWDGRGEPGCGGGNGWFLLGNLGTCSVIVRPSASFRIPRWPSMNL